MFETSIQDESANIETKESIKESLSGYQRDMEASLLLAMTIADRRFKD